MSYMKSTDFFNTGFIPENANSKRIKQGLDSQFISNSCINYMKQNEQTNLSSFNTLYYPVKAVPLPTYGRLTKINDNCPCLRYVQKP